MKLSLPIPVRYKCWPNYGACQPYLGIVERAAAELVEQARRGVPAEKFGESAPDESALYLVGKLQRVAIKGIGILTFQPRLQPDAAGRRVVTASVVLQRAGDAAEEECVCCYGCVTVGVIGRGSFFYETLTGGYAEYEVSICIKGKSFFVKNAKAVDSNFFHKAGDRVIVYSNPFLLSRGNMEVVSNHIFIKYNGVGYNDSPLQQSKWSILNCGKWNIPSGDEVFENNGIYTEYIDSRDSCGLKKAKALDLEIVEIELSHYITSIKAGVCYA